MDKVVLEVLYNRFQSVVDEMGSVIFRAGHTIYVKETSDFGPGLVSPDGEIFAASLTTGVTGLIGTPLDDAIRAIPDYEPGDIIIANDPTTTRGMSTHLPDIHLWKPVFVDGELLCFVFTFIHCSDVGGKVPGSIAPSCDDIFQEGLVLPPQKLFRRGQLNQDLLDIFLHNSRIPDQNWGDFKAIISALNVAEARLHEIVAKYGLATVRAGITGLLDLAEEQARAIVQGFPTGTASFSDYMEGQIVGLGPIRLHLTLTIVSDGTIRLDFAGTDPQVPAALNLPTFSKRGHNTLVPAIVKYLMALDPHLPFNSGLCRIVEVHAPRGSLVNPEPRAAVGVRAATMFRVFDVVMGCLAQLMPGQIPAAGSGIGCIVLVSVPDVESGRNKINVVQPLCGGSGGRPTRDGVDGVDFSLGSLRNVPAESLEKEMPVLINRYRLIPDSAGAGRWRGGVGVELEFTVFVPHTVVTARGMDRYHFRPWGVEGGRAGSLGYTLLNPDGAPAGGSPTRDLGQIDILRLKPGDRLRVGTPGGGGFGDPLDRPIELVLADVQQGLLSPERADADYGVIIESNTVDEAATRAERSRRRAASGGPVFDLGPERAAYDRLWSADVHELLNAAIERFPAAFRYFVKEQLMAALAPRLERGERPAEAEVHALLDRLVEEFAAAS